MSESISGEINRVKYWYATLTSAPYISYLVMEASFINLYVKSGCCLPLLLPHVGWYIMRYESYHLPSYMWLRNITYTIL